MAAPTPAVGRKTASTRLRTPALARLRTIPRLSVVVVNYQRWADTLSLVRDLQRNRLIRNGGAEIIIIDNNSPADRLVKVLRRFESVTLKRWRTNRGFSRAVNAAAGISSGDWFLFLNPDMSAD